MLDQTFGITPSHKQKTFGNFEHPTKLKIEKDIVSILWLIGKKKIKTPYPPNQILVELL